MSKTIKISLAAVTAVVVLFALGIGYISTLISPEKLTQLLISEVRDTAGRELKIAGPVSLRLFPAIAVSAEKVSLSNAAWASQAEMARLEKIELDIQLLPLLSRRIEVGSIALSGLTLYLETNANGNGNWLMGDLAKQSQAKSADTGSGISDSGSVDGNSILIENIRLKDGQINYRASGTPASVYSISQFMLQKSGTSTLIHANIKQGAMDLAVKGSMTSIREVLSRIGSDLTPIALDLEVVLNGKPSQLNGKIVLDPKKPSQFDFSFKSKELDFSAWSTNTVSVAPTAPAVRSDSIAAKAINTITQSVTATKPAPSAQRLFSDTPLPLSALPDGKGSLDIQIGQLVLPNKITLNAVSAVVQMNRQDLDVLNARFQLGKGQFDGVASLRNIKADLPNWVFKGRANGFTLEQLLASTSSKGKVAGGDLRAAFNLSGSGASPHQIASRLSGQSQITIANARISSGFVNQGGDVLISIFDAINPLSKKTNETVLECAVAYLPIRNGLVTIADSIGAETDRLNVSLAGSINLNSEVINVAIYPKEKSGFTAGVDLGNLVRLQGTLAKPQVGINKEAAVTQALSLGLGFLTGGASIVAQNAEGVVNKPHPCRAAMRDWGSIY